MAKQSLLAHVFFALTSILLKVFSSVFKQLSALRCPGWLQTSPNDEPQSVQFTSSGQNNSSQAPSIPNSMRESLVMMELRSALGIWWGSFYTPRPK